MKITATVLAWNPDWKEIVTSYSIAISNRKKIDKILYSMGNDNWQELSETMYWQEGQHLYLNVAFNGHLDIAVLFSG